MSRKTRRLIWSAPLVAVFAVVGALAAFGALGIGDVFAHDAPGAPKNVTANTADGPLGRTTLVLDWDEPDEGVVDRYRIDVSKDGGKFTYHTSTTVTTYTHEGLKASTKRYYRVFAVSDTAGTGPVSRDVSETTNPTSKPAKVALSSPTPQSPTQINLSWQRPDNGGAPISRYCIAANKLIPVGETDAGMVEGTAVMINMEHLFGGPQSTGYWRGQQGHHRRRAGHQLHAQKLGCRGNLALPGLRFQQPGVFTPGVGSTPSQNRHSRPACSSNQVDVDSAGRRRMRTTLACGCIGTVQRSTAVRP